MKQKNNSKKRFYMLKRLSYKKRSWRLSKNFVPAVFVVVAVATLASYFTLIQFEATFTNTSYRVRAEQRTVPSDSLGSVVLGRPTDTTITANVIIKKNWQATLDYGTERGNFTLHKAITQKDEEAVNVLIDGLTPNTQYYYRLRYNLPEQKDYFVSKVYKFHTLRPKGGSFTFAVQSDTHLDVTDKDLYASTVKNELAANPDFVIDLGDKFMTDKVAHTLQELNSSYQMVRDEFSKLASSAPIFLANGNHDGELGWVKSDTANTLPVWAAQSRKKLFPNPGPNSFYSGDITKDKLIGQRNSYYSWQWGDALFVVLDPFWYVKTVNDYAANSDMWEMTLGYQQYKWFKGVLETSPAKYKFVFSHHMLGLSRGNAYWSDYYEWGGKNKDGSWGFDTMRPGWGLPIGQLMAKNKVTMFFQGHDHLYAKQSVGGVVYQNVPEATHVSYRVFKWREYSEVPTMLTPGFIKVGVTPSQVDVNYIGSYVSKNGKTNPKNGETIIKYSIKANR